ncbi:hypothetical protein WMF26_48380 [Sorangium sp. So ce185]|uniref:hypothetical protein n=1 Tax=Sorangium sp. So ce185 TaxID=3133287 RepID=UPI003F61F3ED
MSYGKNETPASPEKVVEAAADAALTGAIEAAKLSSSAVLVAFASNPAVAALATVMPVVLSGLWWTGMHWKRIEAERLWRRITDDWAASEDVTREEIEGRIAARAEEPAVREVIMRSVRALMEQVDSATTVPLGALAQEYLRDPVNKPDAFFRGAVRVLSEIDGGELNELREMLDWVLRTTSRDEVEIRAWNLEVRSRLPGFDELQAEPWVLVTLVDDVVADEPWEREDARITFARVSEPERIFQLLQANGLALPGRATVAGAAPPHIRVPRLTAARFRRTLG